jgi:4'-phosphopantetheinyl transferase
MSNFNLETWLCGPETPELSAGEVHVWKACLDQNKERIQELWRILSGEEQARASRFHFPEHRDRYVVSHGALRDILRRYRRLVREPLKFVTLSHGKPELAEEAGGRKLRFNLSHSQSVALIAVTADREVGVDVEQVRELTDWEHIARRYFSAPERRALDNTPAHERMAAFFNCWTRKEAYAKAKGMGLSMPMNSFSTEVSADKLVRAVPGESSDTTWSLEDLFPGQSYAGALVVEGYLSRLTQWKWDYYTS